MQYHEFVATVRDRGEYATWSEAAHVVTSVLQILAQRITPTETADLAGQLPGPLGDVMRQCGRKHPESFGAEEFRKRVAERIGARPVTAEWDASAVLSTLADVVPDGQLNELLSQLPSGYAPLFGKPDLT